jgi:hypothetical protein
MTWDHWVVWDIPPTSSCIEGSMPEGAISGRNSWERNGYGGPCPPIGTHRYICTAIALNTMLHLPPTAAKRDVLRAIAGHELARANVIGLYKKSGAR